MSDPSFALGYSTRLLVVPEALESPMRDNISELGRIDQKTAPE